MKYLSSQSLTVEKLLSNRALNYGDGVFETMAVSQRKVRLWGFHWQRLNEGLQALGINSPNKLLLEENIDKLIDQVSYDNFIIKLLVYRTGESNGYSAETNNSEYVLIVKKTKAQLPNNELELSPIKLNHNVLLAKHKHLNRLEQIIASNQLKPKNLEDALVCDNDDNVIETINKNIILVKGDQIFSPDLTQCGVYGVALRWLESIRSVGWKKIQISQLSQFDSLLVCNSIRGFHAIKSFQGTTFKTKTKLIKTIISDWEKRN